ncbi:carboxymuconolactone decarboxylase family protein [Bacillus sp. EB01]|uniref:carboxymuconolactone decarboxylase family protein n=1 Tax=Bacillus sp. EB01 TaxID=1347086 RepID=UPI0005C49873|nr:carboxymuconolactone decarboxylase family protein [Bacillus sp. EB01]
METNRYQRGLDIIKKYSLEGNDEISSVQQIRDAYRDLAPDLEELVVSFGFGDIYSREGLSDKERTLVTLSGLTTLGTEPQLELHINNGLNIGLTSKQIVGAVMHMLPYAGFPRVLNALAVVKRVFAQRNVTVQDYEMVSKA